jgi:acyl-coenzyme A thioesterase PaaI-like protein
VVGGVLTIDLSVGFMKGSFGDKVTAEGRVLHGGKSTAFCEAEARDDKGTLLAKAIGTFKLLTDKEKKTDNEPLTVRVEAGVNPLVG